MTFFSSPPLTAQQKSFHWNGLSGASMSLAISSLKPTSDMPLLIITQDAIASFHLAQELRFFMPDTTVQIFPDWETLPYDTFSPHQDIISERLFSLYQLATKAPAIMIAQVSTLMHRLLPANSLLANSFVLKVNDHLPMQTLLIQLEKAGYQRVNQVMDHGEFAVRGAILDLFPMGSDIPLRIDWLDDDIDSIRSFDVNNQRSADKHTSISLLPAKEYALDEAGIAHFRQAWRDKFPEANARNNRLYQAVSQGDIAGGLEYYLSLFYPSLSSIADYLQPAARVVWTEGIVNAADQFWKDIDERWQIARFVPERPILDPNQIFISPDQLFASLNNRCHKIDLASAQNTKGTAYWTVDPLPELSLDTTRADGLWCLQSWLNAPEQTQQKVLLLAESTGRREVLIELLAKSSIHVTRADNWNDFLTQDKAGLYLAVSPILRGFSIKDRTLISEQSLYGERVIQHRRRQKATHTEFIDGIRSLAELNIGSPVVHIDHGVGRFMGLEVLTMDNIAREFVVLEYADSDRLYVPVTYLDVISRYSGLSEENAPLHRLGTDKWQKARKQAMEKVRDVAAELLDLYAIRAARKGIAFADPGADYLTFATGFAFEETPDQQQAIDAVLSDMRSERPMDRLICGDVGFGKTEVAMRAAFVAVHSGKQVVVLVPTTLLANQHLENFRDRFSNWPIKIEALSRFNAGKEHTRIIEQVAEGNVDILIGTHKLLQGDISYKSLGLIIIDEEHRFGVKQKETLKSIRAQVDVLAMTATPIPRTLSMALADLREMSIIATPPAKRQSIQTFVQAWNPALVREACLREMRRGGQVYVLFNDVERIGGMADELTKLIPNARIAIAHGQMPERQLERVMRDFYHQQYNILLCTTIIETGIDVPNANTILMVRADKFGLAQLHQLRGRVGRSHHKAYAYLFTPDKESLSADAQKRLEAIAKYDQLGSGFALATQDLEIRGAGELLGHDQSGQMQEIGFDLYSQMLDRAVRAYRRGDIGSLEDDQSTHCDIDLGIAALIPDHYLPDVQSRLVLYKRINSAKTEEQLHELQVEMVDRFGLLPIQTQHLFQTMQLKHQATLIGIKKIDATAQHIRLTFAHKTHFDPTNMIKLLQTQPRLYKMDGPNKLKYMLTMKNASERLVATQLLLTALSVN